MKNFVKSGDVIEFTATAAVASGEGVLLGQLFGYSAGAVALGEKGSLQVEAEVIAKKLATDVMAVGAAVNFDNTTKEVKLAAGDKAGVGIVTEAAGNGDVEVRIKLTPSAA